MREFSCVRGGPRRGRRGSKGERRELPGLEEVKKQAAAPLGSCGARHVVEGGFSPLSLSLSLFESPLTLSTRISFASGRERL
eukprot:scaffold10846_cov32-Tisochrysis_lutea.AAC.1